MKKLTTKETAVLNEIKTRMDGGGWSEVPCCEIFESVEKSSLPGVVSSLVKKGLVTSRREDGQDWLSVTDDGTAAIASISDESTLEKLEIPEWRQASYHMSQIEKYRKHIAEDTDVVDGVYSWKRSGNIVPVCVFTNDAFLQPPATHVVAYEADRDIALAAYRRRMKNHKPSGEELYEMRAAFGTGVTVVNVITGKKTRL